MGFNSATYSWRDWLQKYIFFNYKAQGHIYISSCHSKPLVPHWPMSLSLFFSPLYSICPPEIFASPLCSLHLIHHLSVLWETGLGFYRSRQMCQQPCSQRWKLGWAEPHKWDRFRSSGVPLRQCRRSVWLQLRRTLTTSVSDLQALSNNVLLACVAT